MFSQMIKTLKEGSLPQAESLKGPLHIALIKKEAILRLPKQFRVSDPKINPRTDHMIWAAVLLEDRDLFEITSSILLTEEQPTSAITNGLPPSNRQIISDNLAKLLATSTKLSVQQALQSCINAVSNDCLTCKSH